MSQLKLYLETSVWNFYYADDAPEKRDVTRQFFGQLKQGAYKIYISEVVFREINRSVEEKSEMLNQLIREYNPKILSITDEINDLSIRYVRDEVLPKRAREDSMHCAIATYYEMDAIISWNLRHIANLKRMESINKVNMKSGYLKRLELITPMEVSNG